MRFHFSFLRPNSQSQAGNKRLSLSGVSCICSARSPMRCGHADAAVEPATVLLLLCYTAYATVCSATLPVSTQGTRQSEVLCFAFVLKNVPSTGS